MNIFRIAKSMRWERDAHGEMQAIPVQLFDGTGASLFPGRWNKSKQRVIYCGDSLSTAALENLVHLGGSNPMPKHFASVTIVVPEDVAANRQEAPDLRDGWDNPFNYAMCQSIGDEWYRSGRSLLLKVPSVASPGSYNYLVNQDHADFGRLQMSDQRPYRFDPRLLKSFG